VLTIKSGDVVEIQTVSGNPANLERAGVPAEQIQPELRKIYAGSSAGGEGTRAGHLLTGPIAIEGSDARRTCSKFGFAKSGWTSPTGLQQHGQEWFSLADLFPARRHEDHSARTANEKSGISRRESICPLKAVFSEVWGSHRRNQPAK